MQGKKKLPKSPAPEHMQFNGSYGNCVLKQKTLGSRNRIEDFPILLTILTVPALWPEFNIDQSIVIQIRYRRKMFCFRSHALGSLSLVKNGFSINKVYQNPKGKKL